jgi:futalosine hydrolase
MSHDGGSVRKRGVLVVVASDIEAKAVLDGLGVACTVPDEWEIRACGEGVEVLRTGVGKANAAGATTRTLDGNRHAAVLNVGIGGTYLGRSALGWVVVGSASVFADEGVRTPTGFIESTALGFPPAGSGNVVYADAHLVARLRPVGDAVGAIACVSACSGVDGLAREIADRTGAIAEAMEGAGVGLAAMRAGVPFVEIRVISNLAGDRDRQQWDLKGALARLSRVIGPLVAACAEGR